MAVVLALETEQRNKNYMQVMKEYQRTHFEQIKETTDFTKHITEEVTRNISQHIIQKLSSPIEESKKQIEDHTKVILCKLDENERILEQHKDHRLSRGFLSKTRDEHEAELYEARITALSEDNENLQSQHDELTRIHNASKEQISKLLKSSANWRGKYLHLMAKRPREEGVEPESAKRAAEDRPDSAPVASGDIEMSSAEDISSPTNVSIILDTSNTSVAPNTSHASGMPLPPPPWEHCIFLQRSATDARRNSNETSTSISTLGVPDSQ
jgi:hypothetical protein